MKKRRGSYVGHRSTAHPPGLWTIGPNSPLAVGQKGPVASVSASGPRHPRAGGHPPTSGRLQPPPNAPRKMQPDALDLCEQVGGGDGMLSVDAAWRTLKERERQAQRDSNAAKVQSAVQAVDPVTPCFGVVCL